MNDKQSFFEPGRFFVGCNYWASHAGTEMWSDWNPDCVAQDLEKLAKHHMRVLRVFPLWRDFQPLRMHYAGAGTEREMRFKEQPLPFTEEGQAGVDPVMIQRFRMLCDIAEQKKIRLVVGLLTGWMSGRMLVPEAFSGRKLISDPFVVRWQLRFVRYMVRHFKDHPAIAAWDLGNECNCMEVVTRDTAFAWAAQITNAIRVEDSRHPVISGMHGLRPEGIWTPKDQGEILDILCTHPYPIFTPHCDTDPINEMKSVLHSTAQSVMYSGLGGKPCFIEEIGTLGPMFADEEVARAYARAAMFSALAHDLRGFLWWCANDQSHLTHTPYDWNGEERELGLLRVDGSAKPVLEAMAEFSDFVGKFEFGALPPRMMDAVCILTHGQDQWAAAYGSFLLAKQAGLDISFCWCDDELPQSDVYFMPALTGDISIYRHQMETLIDRVRQGATLYMSLNDALLSPFAEITGVQVRTRARRRDADIVTLGEERFCLNAPVKHTFRTVGAKALATAEDGNPAMTEYAFGKGRVIFCAYPIELDAATIPGVISGEAFVPYYRFYEAMDIRNSEKIASAGSPFLGMTEHILDDHHRLLLIVNHTPRPVSDTVFLKRGCLLRQIPFCGGEVQKNAEGFDVQLPENAGIVVLIQV